MFSDFREHEDGTTIDADLCVIGAGAAGITIARELAGTGRDVLLIESGNLEPEGPTLDLNQGAVTGAPYPPLETTRLRYFGGTTNHWDGHCRPLDSIDFETRSWVPHSGWPIDRAELEPFYARAQKLCELGPYTYEPADWADGLPALVGFDSSRITNRPWQLGPPTRFGERYQEDLRRAENVRVLFNANVVDIVANDPPNSVTELAIRTLDGKSGKIRPKLVVLACGGIENPRLLLASDGVMKGGLGNSGDLVGRFFMEHAHAIIAYAVPEGEIDKFAAYYRGVETTRADGSATIRVKPGLSESLQRKFGLPNACVDMGYGYDRSEGFLALRDAASAFDGERTMDRLGDAVGRMAGDLDGVAVGLYRHFTDESVLWFGANTEPIPNPTSRVTLDGTRDALGQPRAKLDWHLTALDKSATRRTCRIVGEELARLGIARMHIDEWLQADDAEWGELNPRYHHMGTTRMSSTPRTGVVDRDCRVHGISNLYIAGSSVFPTCGYANPTLTIVALAVRLANHLKAIKG